SSPATKLVWHDGHFTFAPINLSGTRSLRSHDGQTTRIDIAGSLLAGGPTLSHPPPSGPPLERAHPGGPDVQGEGGGDADDAAEDRADQPADPAGPRRPLAGRVHGAVADRGQVALAHDPGNDAHRQSRRADSDPEVGAATDEQRYRPQHRAHDAQR